jgi:glyoxylase-like metal-dependent hydrolase (beta-lactamase superfamily II)
MMEIRRVSEHIWSVRAWVLIPVHVWLVKDDAEGVTLVDAGISPMTKAIQRAIRQMDSGPLRRIVLTHGHSDHVGAVVPLLKTDRVPVYVHSDEIEFMEGDKPYPRRKKRAASLPRGIAEALPGCPDGKLSRIGGLTPFFAPGHSPGHTVYYHEQDQVLLAGDLFTSKRGKLHRPMPIFTADMGEAIKSGEIVRSLRPKRVEVCHGEPVMNPAEHWEEYIRQNERWLLQH